MIKLTLGPLAALICILLLPSAPAIGQTNPSPAPGTTFKDCTNCPVMVVLPPGVFVMGSRETAREQPPRLVSIKQPFAMGRFEVTFAEWDACLAAGACQHNPHDHKWGRGTRPVINVDFFMVEQYLAWLSQTTGQTYRLPTEAEWEYAARAGSTTRFWFGDKADAGLINCRDCRTRYSAKQNAPVGTFPANPFGLHDMHGNAYEWVQDCWNPDYQGAPKTAEARLSGDCRQRVIRGGSWYYFQRQARSASRAINPANVRSYWLSFRVVRDLP